MVVKTLGVKKALASATANLVGDLKDSPSTCLKTPTLHVVHLGFCVVLYLYKGVLVEPHRLST